MSRRFAGSGQYRRAGRSAPSGEVAYDFGAYSPLFFIQDYAADITLDGSDVTAWAVQEGTATIVRDTSANDPEFLGEGSGVDFASEFLDLSGTGSETDDLVCIVRMTVDTVAATRYLLDLNGAADRLIFCLGAPGTSNLGVFDTVGRNSGVACPTGDNVIAWRYRAGAGLDIWISTTKVATGVLVASAGRTMGTSGRIGSAATAATALIDGSIRALGLWPDLTDSEIGDLIVALEAI